MENEIVIFTSKNEDVSLAVKIESETVWLTQAQMTELFGVDRTVVTRHINNVFKEGELERESNVQFLHIANSDRPVKFYNLDVIISVGYRVKSKRGVEFRKWANSVLKRYILKGYAVNNNRIQQLGEVIRILKRTENSLDSKQVDDSFKGSIGNIYQSFGGQELYPTLEEKAAHLLYFVTKNHSFFDGNKRIAAAIFL